MTKPHPDIPPAFETAGSKVGDGANEPTEAAFDGLHLWRQTLGDRALEHELLTLFDRRSRDLVRRLAETHVPAERRDLAHALKGSGLAIGAGRVARLAGVYESLADRCDADQPVAAAYRQLAEAVAEARAAIAAIRAMR